MKYEKAEARVIYFNNGDAILTGSKACGNVSEFGDCGGTHLLDCRRKDAYFDVCGGLFTDWNRCSLNPQKNSGL